MLSVADQTSGLLKFNCNVSFVLRKILATLVDIFGNIGCDPGTGWIDAGNQTNDRTLVRNSSVISGITIDDLTSCPFPTLGTEWTQYATDDFTNLGSHTAIYSTSPPLITTQPSSVTVCEVSLTSFRLIASGKRSGYHVK